MTTERRTFTVELVPETRADGKLRLRGLAAVFGEPSEDIGFREVLEPGAFAQALQEGDPLLLWQHDSTSPLARVSAGNLTLSETSRGLEFEAELPPTSVAKDALELVRSGVVKAMSFAFSMTDGRDRWEQRDGEPWRFISRIGRLFEISLVSEPAYAATSVEARATKATSGRLRAKEPAPYGPGSEHSYFRDLWVVTQNKARREATELMPGGVGGAGGLPVDTEHGFDPDPEGAERRLEQRDVTSADPGAASFMGPGHLGAFFAEADRAQGTLAAALGLRPLERGMKEIDIPRLDTGASVAVQVAQNDAASETDIDSGAEVGQIALITGRQDVSIQALIQADPMLDEVLARDLGKAIAAARDVQLVAGSNASGQTLGLAIVTGIKTTAYTDASPTSQEFIAKTWAAYNEIATNGRGTATTSEYLTVIHPRRLAWLFANAQNSQTIAPQLPGRIVPCAGLRATLGAGTNEDEAFVLLPAELPAFAGPVTIVVDSNTLSGTLQVRFVAYQQLGTGFGRAPEAICRLSGTGLVAPTL